jgi:hypothetical protein
MAIFLLKIAGVNNVTPFMEKEQFIENSSPIFGDSSSVFGDFS